MCSNFWTWVWVIIGHVRKLNTLHKLLGGDNNARPKQQYYLGQLISIVCTLSAFWMVVPPRVVVVPPIVVVRLLESKFMTPF